MGAREQGQIGPQGSLDSYQQIQPLLAGFVSTASAAAVLCRWQMSAMSWPPMTCRRSSRRGRGRGKPQGQLSWQVRLVS